MELSQDGQWFHQGPSYYLSSVLNPTELAAFSDPSSYIPGPSPYILCPSISSHSPHRVTKLLWHLEPSVFFLLYSGIEYEVSKCLLTFIDFDHCKPIPELVSTGWGWVMLIHLLKPVKPLGLISSPTLIKDGSLKEIQVPLARRGR